MARFGLRTTPTERPSLARAEALYAESCATCHGATGDADTERAQHARPAAGQLPGPGTARGALALPRLQHAHLRDPRHGHGVLRHPLPRRPLEPRLLRLPAGPRRRPGRGRSGAPRCPWPTWPSRSDHEMLEALRREGHPAPARASSTSARRRAFQEPPAGVGVDRTRRHAAPGRWPRSRTARARDADRLVLDAYLQGFEPLEPRLRARDAEGTLDVEARLPRPARRPCQRRRSRGRAGRARALDERLARLGGAARGRAVPGRARHLLPRGRRGRPAGRRAAGRRAASSAGRTPRATSTRAGSPPCPRGSPPGGLANRVARRRPRQRELTEAVIALARRRRAVLDQLLDDLARSRPGAGRDTSASRLEATLTPAQPLPPRRALVPGRLPRGGGDGALHPGPPPRRARPAAREVWAGAAAGLVVVARPRACS